MSKRPPSPQKNGKNRASVAFSSDLPPDVAQALAEDVAVTAVGSIGVPVPESELVGIPYLGETRRQALALAGLRTVADLRRATVEEIGGVKGVGMVNAGRVKEWLSVQAEMPMVAAATPVPLTDVSASLRAASNQDIQEVFEKLGSATAQLKESLPPKTRDRALDRQLNKLDSVASELAEGPDTLSVEQVQEAVKTLDKIAALLQAAAELEKLPPKKQAVLIDELRARRKRLQKTLDV